MINILNSNDRLNNPFGLIVPFSVCGKTDGSFDFEVFDCVEDIMACEMSDGITDYLTDSFYTRINGLLGDTVRDLGYRPDYAVTHSFLLNYECASPCAPAGEAQCIKDAEQYCDMTESDFSSDEFPVFAVTSGSAILSVCGVNGMTGEKSVEIAVSTAENYRRRGYALSCLVGMTNYLVSRGYTVSYVCESDNEASAELAEKAGFELMSRDYNFVCYEEE